jgi:predicted small lipoprotein YifL
MNKTLRYAALTLALFTFAGCGDRPNQVVVDPQMTPEKEKEMYDAYDKQMAESVPNP